MATELEIRAEQARQLLDNEVFKQAFYPIQVAIMDEIAATDIKDSEARNQLGLKLQVAREFEQNILEAIEDLKIEDRKPEFDSPTTL